MSLTVSVVQERNYRALNVSVFNGRAACKFSLIILLSFFMITTFFECHEALSVAFYLFIVYRKSNKQKTTELFLNTEVI